jgi:ribosomal protein L40E
VSKHPPSEISRCEKCGVSVSREALYCQRCGEKILRSQSSHYPADRVADFFPTYYITLISIIQVTAFGYLLLVAKDQLSSILASTYDPLWTVLIVGMFIMIAATWMNYTHYVTSLKLTPSSLDALIPFCFGATQALVIFSISLQQLAWVYFAMAANAMVAISQTYFTVRQVRLHQEYEENRAWVEKSGALSTLKRWFAVRLLIFLFFGIVEALLNLHSLFLAVVYLALCIMSFVFVGFGAKQMTSTS